MDANQDIQMYTKAVFNLTMSPVDSPNGTYHVKNGKIYLGYEHVPMEHFSTSPHMWFIFH